jgi:transposase
MRNSTTMSWVAMDTAAETIHVAIFRGEEATPSAEFEVKADAQGVGRLKKKLEKETGAVKCVYEAGPCGYGLCRTLKASGYPCEVIAPSLTPRKPGERVKTNRLDARRLGVYYRGGQLTPVRIPDEVQEALRDLLRARDDVRRNLQQSRQRLNGFLLRHGHHFKEGSRWTRKHWAWVKAVQFEEQMLQMVVDEHITVVETQIEQMKRFDQKIHEISQRPEYAAKVSAYSVLRGIQTRSAMTIIAEGGDLPSVWGGSSIYGFDWNSAWRRQHRRTAKATLDHQNRECVLKEDSDRSGLVLSEATPCGSRDPKPET